ncbi:MAG: type II toxin-antitoxin system PemK/MazF family toxin [Thermodesulfovibrionia bacterium]|nr:type II toxin-antitoxin system PemK/MazF family toxin [Thermodesulfovibrionia bacterium]
MIHEGQVVLFRFPQTDQISGKLRPALVIREIPSSYGDWLICMISSQLSQQIPEFDEIIREDDADFGRSGLKTSSVVRISRLAVVNRKVLLGSIGDIDSERLMSIKKKLSEWIIGP